MDRVTSIANFLIRQEENAYAIWSLYLKNIWTYVLTSEDYSKEILFLTL